MQQSRDLIKGLMMVLEANMKLRKRQDQITKQKENGGTEIAILDK